MALIFKNIVWKCPLRRNCLGKQLPLSCKFQSLAMMVVSSCDEAFTARGRCTQPSSYGAESEATTFVLQSFRRLPYVTVSARDGKLHMREPAWEEDYSFGIQESYLPIAKKRYPSNFCLLRGHAFFVATTCKVTRNLRLLPHSIDNRA